MIKILLKAIIGMVKIFLLNKGLKKRKENLSIVEEKIDENYNKLN